MLAEIQGTIVNYLKTLVPDGFDKKDALKQKPHKLEIDTRILVAPDRTARQYHIPTDHRR